MLGKSVFRRKNRGGRAFREGVVERGEAADGAAAAKHGRSRAGGVGKGFKI